MSGGKRTGGSAKVKRKKAARAGLRYRHTPGRPPKPRKPLRVRDFVFGAGILVGSAVLIAGFALGPYAWAGDLWRTAAPVWPGEGYGFAATVGVLLPVAVAAGSLALGRVTALRKEQRPFPALLFGMAALSGGVVAVMAVAVAMNAMRPKGSSRHGYCSASGEYCWVSGNYPYVWLVGLAATVLGALLVGKLYAQYAERCKSRPQPLA